MNEKQTSLPRFFGNRCAPHQESDVNDERPTKKTSKKDKGHIVGIVESRHSKMKESGCFKTGSWFSLNHYCKISRNKI